MNALFSWRSWGLRLLGSASGRLGFAILAVLLSAAVVGPTLYKVDPWDMAAAPMAAPLNADTPLGSDSLGRDVAAAVLSGARVSLLTALGVIFGAGVIGVAVGGIAGFAGGRTNSVLNAGIELFQSVPAFVLALVVVAILTPNLSTMVLALSLVSWPVVARLTRAEVMAVRQLDYVAAARVQGERPLAVLWIHVLPNVMPTIVAALAYVASNAILLEGALSFLGLGDPNHMSWGYMINAGRTILRQAWWVSAVPGVAIMVSVIGINLVGEAVRQAFDPKNLRRARA